MVAVEALALHLVQGTHLPQGVQGGAERQNLQENAWPPCEVDQGVWQSQNTCSNL